MRHRASRDCCGHGCRDFLEGELLTYVVDDENGLVLDILDAAQLHLIVRSSGEVNNKAQFVRKVTECLEWCGQAYSHGRG